MLSPIKLRNCTSDPKTPRSILIQRRPINYPAKRFFGHHLKLKEKAGLIQMKTTKKAFDFTYLCRSFTYMHSGRKVDPFFKYFAHRISFL